MDKINLADAKAHFSKLVGKAAAGETVQIMRRGKPVAQITRVEKPRRPVDLGALKKVTSSMPRQSQSAGEFIREQREQDRF